MNERFTIVVRRLIDDGKVRSKNQLANKIGTYHHVIKQMERGERTVNVKYIAKLSKLFNVNPNFLFGLSNEIYFKGTLFRSGNEEKLN